MIDYKLKVFISSRCGGKYTIARKSLKKLLEVTGLAKAFVYETEPASSSNTEDSYLEHIDDSHLCVFLVDNEDGVSPAVIKEEKRAKEKNLRLIYLFCDENRKEATPMQEEIRVSFSQKYSVVHEFSDIVSEAYNSVMQDIIAVYKKKKELFSTAKREVESVDGKSINTETYSMLTTSFSKFQHVADVLINDILPENSLEKKGEETPLERLLSAHLLTVLFQKPYDEAVIDGICYEVLRENSDNEICELLKIRYQAQKYYYLAKYDECIEELQKAISFAMEKQSIAEWILNDIAIDIRFLQGRIDERNSTITLENPGQKLIDASNEPVYFPYLDRQVENMHEEIGKKYYSQLSISPYTTVFERLDVFFFPLANAFCIAELHGSIVQTEITRDRLISIYSMLCFLYDDRELIVEYIKYLITNRDFEKLDAVIRTYNQKIDILNGRDIDTILDCINNMFDPIHRTMSKYLLVSRLGCYMSDAVYSTLYNELVEYAMRWVCDDNRISKFSRFIFDFFSQNIYRAEGKDIVTFICNVFAHHLKRYYIDCFKILQRIDYSRIDLMKQDKIKKAFVKYGLEENECFFDSFYYSAILQFCKNTMLTYEDIESIIAEKNPSFYKHTFMFELSAQRNQDLSEYVKSYLEEARSRNRTLGMKDVGYSYESLDVVYNVLKTKKIALSSELFRNVVDVGLETLSSEKQTVRAKMAAVRLLQLVYFRNDGQDEIWNEVSKQMIAETATFSTGETNPFSKDTNHILSFQYRLFINSSFEPRFEVLLDKLYSTDTSESYTIVQFLRIITDFLESAKAQLENEALVSAFLYFSIFMSQHKEQDVKYYAVLCLIELTNFVNARRLALIHLSQIMDSGSQAAKIAILTRLGQIQIDKDDAYLRQIINKGKSDGNYLVRYAALRKEPQISEPRQ